MKDRTIPGLWEEQELSGARNAQVATPVACSSGFVTVGKAGSKDSDSVILALIRHIQNLRGG